MKLSVITINKNNAFGLRKTIESVVNQTFNDFEYIVIDGASDDGSAEVIKNYSDRISFWVSEPDSGIYSAMNKGIRKAQGEYVQFLNSGDYLVDEKVYERFFCEDIHTDIAYGNRINLYPDGHILLNKGKQKSNLTFEDVYKGCIPHTAAFTKRCLFEKYGLFDESFRIMSDTGFFLKAIGLGKSSSQYVDVTISYFDMEGISNNPKMRDLFDKEYVEMKKQVLSPELVEAYDFYLQYNSKISSITNCRFAKTLFRIAFWISRKTVNQ